MTRRARSFVTLSLSILIIFILMFSILPYKGHVTPSVKPMIDADAIADNAAGLAQPDANSRFNKPPRAVFAAIAARPPFSPSRKPGPAVSLGASSGTAPPFKLLGTKIENGKGWALLKPNDGGQAEWVTSGERIAGWEIAEISQVRVSTRSGDISEQIELFDN